MGKRDELQTTLEALSEHKVYYQPPEKTKLSYPAIVYNRSDIKRLFASNAPYDSKTRYQITLISRDPEDPLLEKLLSLPYAGFDREYVVDGLYHTIITLFY